MIHKQPHSTVTCVYLSLNLGTDSAATGYWPHPLPRLPSRHPLLHANPKVCQHFIHVSTEDTLKNVKLHLCVSWQWSLWLGGTRDTQCHWPVSEEIGPQEKETALCQAFLLPGFHSIWTHRLHICHCHPWTSFSSCVFIHLLSFQPQEIYSKHAGSKGSEWDSAFMS